MAVDTPGRRVDTGLRKSRHAATVVLSFWEVGTRGLQVDTPPAAGPPGRRAAGPPGRRAAKAISWC
jgi:hypothetical protein